MANAIDDGFEIKKDGERPKVWDLRIFQGIINGRETAAKLVCPSV